jgi:hypothetical protein
VSRLISRDPFARQELHRERVTVQIEACRWCDGVKRTPAGKRYLFQYHTESDGGRTFPHSGPFCSKSCHDSYHG